MEKQKIANRRVGLLDDIRGLCIAGVVVFHALFDLIYIYGVGASIPGVNMIMSVVQPLGSGAFVFISGIVSRYSKNNIKRGVLVLILGTGISIVTGIVAPQTAVRFGILSLLGCGMLLFGLLERFLPWVKNLTSHKRKPLISGAFFVALFLFCWNIPNGYIGLFGKSWLNIPESMYKLYYLYPLGFSTKDFFSSDYFPLIPWMFLFLAGTSFGVYFKENKAPELFYKSRFKTLNWLGRNSLIVYIAHQPILMLVFWIVFR